MKHQKWLMALALLLTLTACNSSQGIRVDSRLASTDLASVWVNGIQIGQNISGVDRSGLTPLTPENPEPNQYNFEGLRLTTDDAGAIVRIFAQYPDVPLRFGEVTQIGTIPEVEAVLGPNRTTYWFDREQGLQADTYLDRAQGVTATFVYSRGAPYLVWILFERYP
jgi:hypothetical protein